MKLRFKARLQIPCCAVLVLLGMLAAPRACRAEPPQPIQVRYLNNETFVPETSYFVVRSAFEIDGTPHQWIALDIEFRLDQARPLIQTNNKILLKRWNNLFLPDSPRPVRWTDCRLDMDFRELEKAKNLPKDKTFVVWTMGLVYDYATSKHIGSGWSARAPLLITTDSGGKILHAEAPTLWPVEIEPLNDSFQRTIDVRPAAIRLKHLIPRPEVRAFQAAPKAEPPKMVLVAPEGQIWSRASFGVAFETVDSADKARELILLQHPGGMILQTREEYAAVIEAVERLGWAGKDLLPAGAEFFGVSVEAVEGLGWHVRILLLEPRGAQLGDLVLWDYHVTTDGRLGGTRTLIVRAPGGKHNTPSDAKAYSAAIRKRLSRENPKWIPSFLVPRQQVTSLPLPPAKSREAFASIEPASDVSLGTRPVEPAKPSAPATRPTPQNAPDVPVFEDARPTLPNGKKTITTPQPTPIRKK